MAQAVYHNLPENQGVLQYRGGKGFLARDIIALFPFHERYIEPFFGAGHVFLMKQPVKYEVVNDLDFQVYNFFKTLRDLPRELVHQLEHTPYSRLEFEKAVDRKSTVPLIEQARQFFIRQNQGFSGKSQNYSNWGVAFDSSRRMPKTISSWQSKIALCSLAASRLRNTMIENQDFQTLIERYSREDGISTLIYCDPPYPKKTRKNKTYSHEMTDEDHARLLEVCLASPAMIAISSYPSAMYDEALKDWDLTTWNVPCHSVGGFVGEKPRRTECLWRNPALMAAYGTQKTLWDESL